MRARFSLFGVLALAFAAQTADAQLPPILNHPQYAWYLPVPGPCTLFVQEYGGPQPDTVVILHGGWGVEHSYLIPAFQGLENKHHLVFYDQRGSLRSRFNQVDNRREQCPDSMITASQHIEDLELLRQALHLKHMKIAGHSQGSYLAMSYLNRYPEHTGTVVIFGPLPPRSRSYWHLTPQDSMQAIARAKERRAFLDDRPAVKEELRKAGVDGPPETLTPQQETTAWLIRDASHTTYNVARTWRTFYGGRAYYIKYVGDLASKTEPKTYNFLPAIKAHSCKFSVIGGTHDYADWGAANAKRWTALVPKVRLDVLQNVGHSAWLDEPEQFRRIMDRDLQDTRACQ